MSEKRKPVITKIQLISNNICFGPSPQPEDEVEQKLSIELGGQVSLSKYAYGCGYGKNKLISYEQWSVEKDTVTAIFDAINRCFYVDYVPYMATDVGSWDIAIYDDKDNIDNFSGPLIGVISFNFVGETISNIIRKNLGRDDLFAFDGNPDRVDHMEVIYNRVTKIVPEHKSEDDARNTVTREYKDTLVIDRNSGTLEIKNMTGAGCEVTHTYYDQLGVENLLNDINTEMQEYIKGNPTDAIINPMETKNYEINIITKHGIETSISGTYDKYGLPTIWPVFIEDLQKFIDYYDFPGEMFSESCFGKVLRREGEIVFCDVSFEEGGKTYCYIADTDDFCLGDLVLVPAGEDNEEKIVRIEAINYFTEDKAPFPVEQAKHIIRKYNPDRDK